MASLPVQANYSPLSIAERVPDVAKVPEVSAASLLQSRRTVRYIPQGTQTVASNGVTQTNILINDNAGYLDPQSVRLSGTFQITSAAVAAGWSLLDDGIHSLMDRVRLYINSQVVEDQGPGFGRKANAEIYSSCPKNWYDSQGTSVGLHKFNEKVFANDNVPGAADAATIQSYVGSYRKNNCALRAQNVSAYQRTGVPFSIPLSLFLGFFRSEYLFPIRNSGTIQLTVDWLNIVNGAFVGAAAGALAGLTWQITDLSVEADILTCDPRYVAVMDSLMSDPTQEGYRLPITTTQILQVNYSGSGAKTLVLPKASANVRQVSWVSQDTASLAGGANAETSWKSAFPHQSYTEAQIVIGSRRFPEVPAAGFGRAYSTLQDGNNMLGNVLGGGLVDMENFSGAVTGGSAAGAGAAAFDTSSAAFIWAYSFDRVKSQFIPLDGESTNAVGGQIQIYVNNAPANAQTLTAMVEYVRFITIKANALSVAG